MFCPQCKAEYRPGFTHCTDCDVDLVDALPAEENFSEEENSLLAGSSDANLQKVWAGNDQVECVSICRRLRNANIPYLVRERDQQFLKAKEQDFVILVSPSNTQVAAAIVHEGEFDFTDSEEDRAVMEIPARDDLPVEEVRGEWDSSSWFPEDATVEISSGNPRKNDSMIEMSLKENRINYRVESQGELKRVFVLPEDETRAREIVREIMEGAPPE